ncbi:MAG: hypothetical protein J6I54_05505 [Bacteroidaceae bacterium]|nr:hypothetical protein [Bacteroidaceae bacterium]MBR1467275.1 hypothetical protein [Bacteroidaceae bacterium]
MITDYTLNTLIALSEAHEGCIPLHHAGIAQVRTDDDLAVYIDMEDGRTLHPHEADEAQVNEAIIQWRDQHGAYFQKILGSMM